MSLRLFAVPVVALALFAAACGEEESEQGGTSEPAAQSETAAPEATQAAADLEDTSAKPTIEKPTDEPPQKLVKEEIVEGDGKAAKKGDTVSVHYVGASHSTGEEFDASWDRGEPFQFELGGGQVIEGWDKGLVGMKEGGRRRLVIPPDMAYGPAGAPPAIAPDETLIFIVDLLEVS